MSIKSKFQNLVSLHLEQTQSLQPQLVLSETDKKTLLQIARNTLATYLQTNEIPEVITDQPTLVEQRATFVTLRDRSSGELRGCKGEVFPREPLVQAVQTTAISSATNDPRFNPVEAYELDNLKIEISVLKPLRPITPDEVVIGKHGLVVSRGSKTGLLLPHVPVVYNLDRETYLKELCYKAGLEEGILEDDDTSLYGFEAEVFEESY